MKGNIKKLAVFVIVAALALFMVAAMASAANDHKRNKTMNAVYAITGSGSCFIAASGLNEKLQPNDGANGMWFWGPCTFDEGTITFNKDGTGSFKAIFHTLDIWSPGFGDTPPDAGAADETWDFTYTMTGNNITITYTKGSYELVFTSGPTVGTPLGVAYIIPPPAKGVVSPDQKILYVSFGAPGIYELTADKANDVSTGMQGICNIVIQGFWISP